MKTNLLKQHAKSFYWASFFLSNDVFNNLYFVGAGTHPGAGMPGVLSSAKVLDKLF